VLALRDVRIRGGVGLELGAIRFLRLRALRFRQPRGLQFLRERAVRGRERIRRKAAQAEILAHQDERGLGVFEVLAAQFDKGPLHRARPVLHGLLELREIPHAHLLPGGQLFPLLDPEPLGIEHRDLGGGGRDEREGE